MTSAVLAGLELAVSGRATEIDAAAGLLCSLGVRRSDPDHAHVLLADESCAPPAAGPRAVLRRHPATADLVGVPDGAVEYATGLALAAAALAAHLGGTDVTVPALDAAAQLFLPPVMAAAYGSDRWPIPRPPMPAPGGGWVSAELGAPGDDDSFDALLGTLPPDIDAAGLAVAAQEWRLPVCNYRSRVAPSAPVEPMRALTDAPADDGLPVVRRELGRAPLDGVKVIDLTAMWAGPLCTWLLARLGADVVKVEPAVRLDGIRAFDGGGVHPGGRSDAPGYDSALFNALNNTKRAVDIDLRDNSGRDRLLGLVEDADLVVDSFSPRVMPNLGLTPAALAAVNPGLLTLSIPAFPPGPNRDWVAYGTGAHALSGLGDTGSGVSEPAVTYPDPICGLTAAVAALAGLVGRSLGRPPARLEVSLLSASLPLLNRVRDSGRVARRDPDLGRSLFGLLLSDPESLLSLDVAASAPGRAGRGPGSDSNATDGRALPHPAGPFRGVCVAATGPPDPPSGAVR